MESIYTTESNQKKPFEYLLWSGCSLTGNASSISSTKSCIISLVNLSKIKFVLPFHLEVCFWLFRRILLSFKPELQNVAQEPIVFLVTPAGCLSFPVYNWVNSLFLGWIFTTNFSVLATKGIFTKGIFSLWAESESEWKSEWSYPLKCLVRDRNRNRNWNPYPTKDLNPYGRIGIGF